VGRRGACPTQACGVCKHQQLPLQLLSSADTTLARSNRSLPHPLSPSPRSLALCTHATTHSRSCSAWKLLRNHGARLVPVPAAATTTTSPGWTLPHLKTAWLDAASHEECLVGRPLQEDQQGQANLQEDEGTPVMMTVMMPTIPAPGAAHTGRGAAPIPAHAHTLLTRGDISNRAVRPPAPAHQPPAHPPWLPAHCGSQHRR